MGYEPISIDILTKRIGLKPNVISSILLILELNGEISHDANGHYIRTKTPA